MAMDLEVPLRGLAAGLIIAAPVGPVNLLCIRRTLEKGWRSGMLSGLGTRIRDVAFLTAGKGESLKDCLARLKASRESELLLWARPIPGKPIHQIELVLANLSGEEERVVVKPLENDPLGALVTRMERQGARRAVASGATAIIAVVNMAALTPNITSVIFPARLPAYALFSRQKIGPMKKSELTSVSISPRPRRMVRQSKWPRMATPTRTSPQQIQTVGGGLRRCRIAIQIGMRMA